VLLSRHSSAGGPGQTAKEAVVDWGRRNEAGFKSASALGEHLRIPQTGSRQAASRARNDVAFLKVFTPFGADDVLDTDWFRCLRRG
jgi:hypothetical protein